MQMSEIEKNTYTVPVMIDRTAYTSKPEGSLVGKIKASMVKNGVVYMTMVEVFDALTAGQSIIPAGLDGGKSSENWREQSLFMVDFDSGISLVEARERYEDAGLPPAFAYHTFSHSDICEKFRLAFVVDDAVRNGSVRDKIMATLIALSGGADAKCTDRARYFNGTNKGGEYYGDTIEVSDVLSLWDDSYAALLPSKASGKTAKKKSDVVKNGRKPSGRSYKVEVSGNIIPFSAWYWRINARYNLAMLNRFFEARKWVEGDHRERFAFIYYNQAKLIYGAEEALALVNEKVELMEEPLSKAELYWAINHTEIHEETNMPELHGDGVFLFNRETIAGEDWLDMTEEEEESCGIFRTREKNARADRNRDVKKERDELAASLHKEGKTPREIKGVLDEQYGELSLSIRSIQRLCAKRDEGCDKIPLTIKYTPPALPQPTQASKADGNGGCEIVPIPTLTPAQKRLLDAIINSLRNILLSGFAGTGKSYIIKKAIEQLEAIGRAVAVCAATGMAASHFPFATTFHRLFHMDGDGYIYKEGDAMAELAGYDMIIIDEASMIKASHMESAINLLRETRKHYYKAPRLVLCFDIMQLPPVNGGYFFEARNFGSLNFERHYLTENMRQTGDIPFTRALNFLRVGENITTCCRYLNRMCSHVEDQDAVYLYAKRWRADAKNREILRNLPGEEIDLGNLVAKIGCEVLITENSRHDNVNQYYNGQRGVLEQVQQKRVCVRTRDGLVWLHKKFLLDSNGHPVLDNNGHHLQGYPLSLAYAVTIHKSQGMTLDSANIDPECFADGQLYVALSRVRSLDGVHLLKPLKEGDCKVSESALAFDTWMRAESRRAAV